MSRSSVVISVERYVHEVKWQYSTCDICTCHYMYILGADHVIKMLMESFVYSLRYSMCYKVYQFE